MKILLLFSIFLNMNVHAGFRVENDDVVPFSYANYSLKTFIKEYAQMMGVNVTYVTSLITDKEKIHLELNSKVKKDEFKKIVYEVLDSYGLMVSEDKDILWIDNARDARFSASAANVYTDNNYSKDAVRSIFIHQLKYPLAGEVARNLRPFMSRFGRVINLSDARTVIIHDKGDNIFRLSETIKYMDTEKAYTNFLNTKPKENPFETDPVKEKIVELETDKKILEKKYMELKEGQRE